MNQELIDYIKQQLNAGENKNKIVTVLQDAGWNSGEIEEVFQSLQKTQLPTESPVENTKVVREEKVEIRLKKNKGRFFHILKRIAITLVCLGLFIYFFPNILGLFFRDIPPINDSDLLLSAITMPDEKDNAYFDLVTKNESSGLMVDSKISFISERNIKGEINEMIAGGKPWDEKVVEEFVLQNKEAFEQLAQAANKPYYQNPDFADFANYSLEIPLPPLISFRQYAKYNALYSHYLAGHGSSTKALDVALYTVNLGQIIEDSQSDLITYLVGIEIKKDGLRAVQKILSETEVDIAQLSRTSTVLENLDSDHWYITGLKSEYTTMSYNLEMMKGWKKSEHEGVAYGDDRESNGFYFQPNQTKNIAHELFSQMIKSGETCAGAEEYPFLDYNYSPFEQYVTENIAGKWIVSVIGNSLGSLKQKKCDEVVLVEGVQTLTAIKMFKKDTGEYPLVLSDLVPKYLKNIPIDSYSGKDLKYSSEEKILYSVGQDLVDDGGDVEKDDMYQITF